MGILWHARPCQSSHKVPFPVSTYIVTNSVLHSVHLHEPRKPPSDTLLSLSKLSFIRFGVQNIEWILLPYFFEVSFNLREFLAEGAVENLVLQNLLEMFAGRLSIKRKCAAELSVLGYRRMVFQLNECDLNSLSL